MTDVELAAFLGFTGLRDEDATRAVIGLSPEARVTYERMAQVERELALWTNGLGPKPKGVMVDGPRKRGGRLG